ncbi:MAG: glycosyltransferase family 39 protein [Candidatus Diapherotrites archaeon]|nr:glycosyltransferase family 39 protein [Candidatus Diapherotrites archaeon]
MSVTRKKTIIILALLLIVAFLVRVTFISLDLIPWWDSLEYASNARFFAGTHIYFSSLRPPLLSFLMIPFHTSLKLMEVSNAFLAVCSLLMAFIFFKEVSDRRTSLLVTAILATNFLFALRSYQISTESGVILFTLLVLYSFVKAAKDKKWFYLSGVSTGLASLFRYPLFLVGIAGLAWYLYWAPERKNTRRMLAIWVSTVFLVTLPWLVCNQIMFGFPIYSMLEGIWVFSQTYPMFQSWNYYLTHIFELANPLILVFSIVGLFSHETLSKKKSLLLVWMLISISFFHLQGVKEIRYLLPVLPMVAFFSIEGMKKVFSLSKRLRGKEGYLVLAIILANLVYTGMYMEGAYKDRVMRVDGVAIASKVLKSITQKDAIIYTNFWPEVAFYSERHVKGIFTITTKEEFMENLGKADYVLIGKPRFENPDINKEFLDSVEQLEYVGEYGGPTDYDKVFVYRVKDRFREKNPVFKNPLWDGKF